MKSRQAIAPGKVNLCLFLGPTREDGRHALVSLMQSVYGLHDLLCLEPGGGDGDEVVCPAVEGPNVAAQALRAFREATGWDGPPVRLRIRKGIPVAGGMAGGSADAAAALRLAAQAAGVEDDELLHRLAAALGSDVPAQLRPGLALVTGGGEEVRRLPEIDWETGIVAVRSAERLSTADVFREADRLGLPRSQDDLAARRRDVEGAVRGEHSIPGSAVPAELFVNDLEPATLSLCPSVADALERLRVAGADVAMVSGSGPTAFGLFLGEDGTTRADAAYEALRPGADLVRWTAG